MYKADVQKLSHNVYVANHKKCHMSTHPKAVNELNIHIRLCKTISPDPATHNHNMVLISSPNISNQPLSMCQKNRNTQSII